MKSAQDIHRNSEKTNGYNNRLSDRLIQGQTELNTYIQCCKFSRGVGGPRQEVTAPHTEPEDPESSLGTWSMTASDVNKHAA